MTDSKAATTYKGTKVTIREVEDTEGGVDVLMDLTLILDKDNNLKVIDNPTTDWIDFVDTDTQFVMKKIVFIS